MTIYFFDQIFIQLSSIQQKKCIAKCIAWVMKYYVNWNETRYWYFYFVDEHQSEKGKLFQKSETLDVISAVIRTMWEIELCFACGNRDIETT